jgi:hypothetical protein
MNRWSTVLVAAAAVLAPAAAEAQKPSNNMHTRSAETYLSQAEREPVIADKNEFLKKALESAFAGWRHPRTIRARGSRRVRPTWV